MTDSPGATSLDAHPLQRLRALLADAHPPLDPAAWLRVLVAKECDRLALPGSGATLERWRALACVGAADLSLAKLYEGHTDALAILAELGGPDPIDGGLWGVWCAEPPAHRVELVVLPDGATALRGAKAWCSGAASLSHALVSGWNAAGEPCLAVVALRQAGVRLTDQGWRAVGMQASASVDVVFEDVPCVPVGNPGAYVHRPGFLHGGAGVAACWYGAMVGIARYLRDALPADVADPHRLAHLGAVDVAVAQAGAVLREAAAQIDAQPRDDCALVCARARLAVESAALQVMERTARALGAGPLCRDAWFARMMADLPVFIRQSHAERDQAAHGSVVRNQERAPWDL